MEILTWAVAVISAISLVYFFSLPLDYYKRSKFTMQKPVGRDKKESLARTLQPMLTTIGTLQRIDRVVLIIILSVSISYSLGSLRALSAVIGLLVLINVIAKFNYIKETSLKVFESHYKFVYSVAKLSYPLVNYFTLKEDDTSSYHSKDELVYAIRSLPSTVLLPNERQQLEVCLESSDKTVKNIMTPKKRVVSVDPNSILGPVVLNDLQKSGHGYFPVLSKTGEPQGVLTLSDLDDIHDAKQRQKVKDLMTSAFVWVDENVSLEALARVFLSEKRYLICVRDIDGSFSGIVTISDLIKHLTGIVKET